MSEQTPVKCRDCDQPATERVGRRHLCAACARERIAFEAQADKVLDATMERLRRNFGGGR